MIMNKPPIRSLFSFTKKEVGFAFQRARACKQIKGLKVIRVPKLLTSNIAHGKLLIVTPGKAGKAHKRNLLRRRIQSIFWEENLYNHKLITIVYAYREAMNLSFDEIKAFIISCYE